MNQRILVTSKLKRNAGLCFELHSVTRWSVRASRVPGARVSWGLDVVQPQRRQHTDFRGAEGEDRDAAAGPQLWGREELRTLGRMLVSGLGVGDAWARGLPEEVTSGRVRSEGSQTPATDRRLLSSPNTTSSSNCPGPGAARTVKDPHPRSRGQQGCSSLYFYARNGSSTTEHGQSLRQGAR